MLDFVEFFSSLISSSCAAKPLCENLLWNDVLMSFPNFLLFTSFVVAFYTVGIIFSNSSWNSLKNLPITFALTLYGLAKTECIFKLT